MRTDYPRDLVMTAAIFGLATFIWSGWAQAQPPDHWIWRVVLGILGAAGLALMALNIPLAIRHWNAATAIDRHSRAFLIYSVVFWVEAIVAAGLAIWMTVAGHSEAIAPLILVVVGVHFFALAPVFRQPIYCALAVLLIVSGVLAAVLPGRIAASSFWCGVMAAPVFLAAGTWSGILARNRFRELSRQARGSGMTG